MPLPRNPAAGMALVAFGAIGFGLMPLFARTAYAEDLPPLSLLAWRFGIAFLCLLPFAGRMIAARRDTIIAVAAGAGYMGINLFYFLALQHLTVALTVLILFTYPLFVILIGALFFREKLTWPTIGAALLVLIAAILILAPAGPSSSDKGGDVNLLAVGMAFIPPFGYAIFVHMAAKRLSSIAIPVRLGGVFLGGLLAMLVLGLIMDGRIAMPVSASGWGATVGLAIVSTVGALGLLLFGAPIAGAERTGIAGASELVTALAVGALAYNEVLEPTMLAGAAMIVGAILLAARSEHQPQAEQ